MYYTSFSKIGRLFQPPRLKTEGGETLLVARTQLFWGLHKIENGLACWQWVQCHSKHLNSGLELGVLLLYQEEQWPGVRSIAIISGRTVAWS